MFASLEVENHFVKVEDPGGRSVVKFIHNARINICSDGSCRRPTMSPNKRKRLLCKPWKLFPKKIAPKDQLHSAQCRQDMVPPA